MLQTDSGKISVYCQMTSSGACGGGGWTLVMKTDGHKVFLVFISHVIKTKNRNLSINKFKNLGYDR